MVLWLQTVYVLQTLNQCIWFTKYSVNTAYNDVTVYHCYEYLGQYVMSINWHFRVYFDRIVKYFLVSGFHSRGTFSLVDKYYGFNQKYIQIRIRTNTVPDNHASDMAAFLHPSKMYVWNKLNILYDRALLKDCTTSFVIYAYYLWGEKITLKS